MIICYGAHLLILFRTLNKYPKLAKETLKDSEVIKGTVINSDIIKQLMASEECDVESNGPCILIQQNGKKACVVGTLKYRADYCYVYLDAKCVANEMPLSTATYNGRFEEGDTQFLYAPINRGNAEIDSAANVLFAVENQGTVLFSQKNR